MKKEITYFGGPGEDNMPAVFDLVDAALAESDIKKIVLASTRGTTAQFAMHNDSMRKVPSSNLHSL